MRWLALLSLLLWTAACGGDDNPANPSGSSGSGAGNPTGGTGAGGSAATMEGLPCDVAEVLNRHCGTCHAAPPIYGAPMSLVSWDDLHAPAVSDPTRSVLDVLPERLDDPQSPMPPSADMPAEDRAVLDAWIAAGGPNVDEACDDVGPPPGVEVGPEALSCTPSHTFVAHAEGDATAPYHVPEVGADNLYQCFTFKSPFAGKDLQGTAWAPIVDDERVLHHWILYRTKTPQADGGVMPCNMPSDAVFVSGWAPGGLNFELPQDVGLELSTGEEEWLILQLHYHNTAQHADAFDASGVALCTTETPRQHLAGVFTLGAVGINLPAFSTNQSVSGTCPSWATNLLPTSLEMIASFPHMHELGRTFRTDIYRGGDNGSEENLVTVDPWVFDNQEFYRHDPPVPFNPGDSITTTCTYDNPNPFNVTFGEATEDEMCFNFVMLYPIDIFGDDRTCGLF